MHWDILDEERQALLPALALFKEQQFYLAGGTALTLQLGHRTSIDFDFYTTEKLQDMLPLQAVIQEQIASFTTDHLADGTLIGHVGSVELSCFRYPYPLLESLIEANTLQLASIPDIAAMKIAAIAQRGLRRDFVDVYAIAQQHSLGEILQWTTQKYPSLDIYIALRALVFFEDADADTSLRGKQLTQPIAWDAVKQYFYGEVQRLEKQWL